MNTVIILAAGQGKRMNASSNKQYLILKDRPILAHTISAFEKCPMINQIILVVHEDEQELCKKNILEKYKYTKIKHLVKGGKERQESVYNGLKAIDEKTNIVLIHDGARPLITEQVIVRCIHGAIEYGAVSAGVPIKETIKIMGKDRFVSYTPKREDVWVTQTPQTFQKDTILKAHEFAIAQEIIGTDDAMLVEHMGMKIKMVEGDYENIKITTPEDLIAAEAILNYKRKK
ncbi:2-C-methyl-D-erythritol 4-phosphate cytidylyltransferase [Anaerosolibacter sp.]|uniref:2-C-methyl-D-erythritol 4-phosphate cytidylyltransferase n=1 Tax=Anaerosolibacter sp. TaxID=1872527 RepID=UPI0039EEA42D